MKKKFVVLFLLLFQSIFSQGSINPEMNSEGLAKTLANPVASLATLPINYDFDNNIGPNDSSQQSAITFQPVIPYKLNEDWNLISRSVFSVVDQSGSFTGNHMGNGDLLQTFFFSPTRVKKGGLIWGVGPVMSIPIASQDQFGTGKFSLGPEVVVLKQTGHWTYGMLGYQIWSVAGEGFRNDVSNLFIQPFLSYVTSNSVTYTLKSEATYDWEKSEWSVPIFARVGKLVKIKGQLVNVAAGVKYWVHSSKNGPEGAALRLEWTFLFPQK